MSRAFKIHQIAKFTAREQKSLPGIHLRHLGYSEIIAVWTRDEEDGISGINSIIQ